VPRTPGREDEDEAGQIEDEGEVEAAHAGERGQG
jgi:hypothetical protein